MVVPPSPRVSSHFSRPLQDFLGAPTTTGTSTSNETRQEQEGEESRPPVNESHAVENEVADKLQALPSLSTRQAQLLAAIINNLPEDVQSIFCEEQRHDATKDERLYPNFSFALARIPRNSRIKIDLIFAIKTLIGESPTAMHLAMMNVYYRYIDDKSNGGVKPHHRRVFQNMMFPRQERRGEIEKAQRIVHILMEDSVHMHQSSSVLFGQDGAPEWNTESKQVRNTSPIDLARNLYEIVSTTTQLPKIMKEMKSFLEAMEKINATNAVVRDQRDEHEQGPCDSNRDQTDSRSSSIVSLTMLNDMLRLFFFSPSAAYVIHTTTTIGASSLLEDEGEDGDGDFESSSVVCGTQGFILVCYGKHDKHNKKPCSC